MKRKVINFLLIGYQISTRIGLWKNKYFISLFRIAYYQYKSISEKNTIKFINKNINDGDCVIDVGAMIGFYTFHLALNTGNSGKVYAFEPEKKNFEILEKYLNKANLSHRALLTNSAVSSRSGKVQLAINKNHPADHHISVDKNKNFQMISSISLDGFIEKNDVNLIKFIKIDVQGHELEVLKGCKMAFKRDKPMILLEIDYDALKRSNNSPKDLINYLGSFNYKPYIINSDGVFNEIKQNEIELFMKKNGGYYDFLFIAD
jgi:FkbM family methyltransferase